MERLTKGKLAAQSGVNTATVRYYEKRELLPEPPRSMPVTECFQRKALTECGLSNKLRN